MRPRNAILAAGLFVAATVAAAPATASTPVAPDIPAVPAAPSANLPCSVELSIIGAGRYREIRVDDTTSDRYISEIGEVPGGRNVRSLATGFYHADFGLKDRYHLGNTSTSLFSLGAFTDDEGNDTIAVTSLGSGWGGFRRLVATGDAVESDHAPNLYGLHDNGRLYRYRIAAGTGGPRLTGAGSVAGFSDLKTITLISVTPSYDALLANTTSGQLVVIKIPTNSTMTATRTVIRSRTWQGFEHLVVADCHDGWNNVLLGVDHDTSSAYAYSMADLRNSSSAILGHGPVAGSWPWLVLNSLYEAGLEPEAA